MSQRNDIHLIILNFYILTNFFLYWSEIINHNTILQEIYQYPEIHPKKTDLSTYFNNCLLKYHLWKLTIIGKINTTCYF